MVLSTDPPLSPRWWLKRLHQKLNDRQYKIKLYTDYYNGEPPRYPWLPDQAYDEFKRLLHLTRSNYMGLVIDSAAERMQVTGFTIGNSELADEEIWRVWQENHMDTNSDLAIIESLKCGTSYILVEPNSKDSETPKMYVEHPSQVIVEYVPGSSRTEVAAALKMWVDDWTGKVFATVYTPDYLFKFQADNRTVVGSSELGSYQWAERPVDGEAFGAPNPLGVVPFAEIPNNPDMLTGGISEIRDLLSIQDRVAKTLADRLMTQDYGAFPQKWASGFPDEDATGQTTKIDVGRNRMVTSDAKETQFGQWDAAPLSGYLEAKREDVKDIASRSRVPAQYLLGDMSNVNGQTLQAAESGHTSKIRQRMRPMGDGFEQAIALVRLITGNSDTPIIETKWRNPEYRSEGELVDALVKMKTLGVPEEALWERWGASEVEIRRWRKLADEQAARDPIGQATALLGQNNVPPVDPNAPQPPPPIGSAA